MPVLSFLVSLVDSSRMGTGRRMTVTETRAFIRRGSHDFGRNASPRQAQAVANSFHVNRNQKVRKVVRRVYVCMYGLIMYVGMSDAAHESSLTESAVKLRASRYL